MTAAVSSTPSSIGIDFVGGGTAMGSTETAGVVPQANWNGAVGNASSGALSLVDASGNSTGATVTWNANNTYLTPITDTPGNARMMHGYLDTTNTSVSTVTVSGLAASASGYDVYVYVDGDNGNASRAANYQISGSGFPTAIISINDLQSMNFTGVFTRASNAAGNYVRFTISRTTFTLTATPGASSDAFPRAPINAIQIVPASTLQPIGIDFVGSGTSLMTTDVAGVVPQANWNSANGWASSTPVGLVDANGSNTGATVSWTANNTYLLPISPNSGDAGMMQGYLDTSNTSTTTVNVAGLPSSSNGYDVYVYVDGDNGGSSRTGNYQISGPGISTTSLTANDPGFVNFSGTYTSGTNYVRFSITGTAFTLTATGGTSSDSFPRAPVNAIQVVAR